MRNIKYWIWLSIFNFKPKEKIDLLKLFNFNPETIWNIKKDLLYSKLMEIKISKNRVEKIVEDITNSKLNFGVEELDNLEKELKKNNIKVITCIDDLYPKRLLNIYDYPIISFDCYLRYYQHLFLCFVLVFPCLIKTTNKLPLSLHRCTKMCLQN